MRDPEERQRWVDALLRVRRPLGRRPMTTPAPYRGLECFHTEHGDWFFGREALTEELLRLAGRPGLLMVVGPSGSGKSSVLRAGLGFALRQQGKRCLLMTLARTRHAGSPSWTARRCWSSTSSRRFSRSARTARSGRRSPRPARPW